VLRYSALSLVIFYNPHIFIFIFCKFITVEYGKFEVKDTCVPSHYWTGLHGLWQLKTYDYVYGMIYSLYWHVVCTWQNLKNISFCSVWHQSPTATSPTPVPLLFHVYPTVLWFEAGSQWEHISYCFYHSARLITKDFKRTHTKETAECKYSNACKTYIHIQMRTSAEFCTEHSKFLDYCTLVRTKRKFEKLGLAESRLHCCAKSIVVQISL